MKSYTNKTKNVLNGFPSGSMNNASPLTCPLARGLGAWPLPVCCQLGFISQPLCRDVSFHQCSCSGESYDLGMLVKFCEVSRLMFYTISDVGMALCMYMGNGASPKLIVDWRSWQVNETQLLRVRENFFRMMGIDNQAQLLLTFSLLSACAVLQWFCPCVGEDGLGRCGSEGMGWRKRHLSQWVASLNRALSFSLPHL